MSTLDELVQLAQEETALDARRFSLRALREQLLRSRQAMMQRCVVAWSGVGSALSEVSMPVEVPPRAGGWGLAWGLSWGAPTAGSALVEPRLTLPPMCRVEAIEARDRLTLAWRPVAVVRPDDADVALAPRAFLHFTHLTLVGFPEEWQAYDGVRLRGTLVPAIAGVDPAVSSLAPDVIFGPLFTRAVGLDGAVWLAQRAGERVTASSIRAEQRAVQRDLVRQVREQGRIELRRFAEAGTPAGIAA